MRTPTLMAGLTLTASASLLAQLFTGFGHLPKQNLNYATGISDDGRVVVGISTHLDPPAVPFPVFHAYRWMANTGMTAISNALPNAKESVTYAISGDGSTIVTLVGASDSSWHAFRVRSGGPQMDLGDLPGGEYQTRGDGLSADGTKIVGSAWGANGVVPILWTEQSGLIPLAFPLDSSGPHYGSAITRDGTVVIGYGASALTTTTTGSFRWTEETGWVNLDRPGDSGSIVSAVSDDGNVIVGSSDRAAVRWTPATGFVPLPVDVRFGPRPTAVARDLTGDGSLTVGWASANRGETTSAILWDRANRMWVLDSLLPQLGFDLDGWSLTMATAISGNGRYLAGEGIHNGLFESYLLDFGPRGFMTPIPEPSIYGVVGVLSLLVSILRRRTPSHQSSSL